jgi:hypothetical protein
MRNDHIFVLLLVVLLPLSGCFDGAVGDAEGADDESSTTVVNNYYNNTTYIENQQDMKITSGMFGSCSSWTNSTTDGVTTSNCNQWDRPATGTYEFVDLPENSTIEIKGLSSAVGPLNYFMIICDSGFTSGSLYLGGQYTMGVIATDGGNCSLVNSGSTYLGYWSIAYNIMPISIV